jgi:protein-tyrosine-phosphatase
MRVLFVCTGNTCRSPMAERLARMLHPDDEWESAGVMPTGFMHPVTARMLESRGADFLGFVGRDVAEVDLGAFDHVVLIGETARACAPDPPGGVEVHHWDVADPFEVRGPEADVLAAYERCAEDILRRIAELVDGAASAD